MDYEAELTVALEAASAGIEAMAPADGDLRTAGSTDSKENVNDLVTRYDRESQAAVVGAIAEAFPDDRLVGEEDEQASTTTDRGREWVVDPIDGTSNFAVGFPYYCVSIALQVDGEAVVGVVASPEAALDRCWYGVRGEGAYVAPQSELDAESPGGRRLSVSGQSGLSGAFVFGRLSERNDERRQIDRRIVEEIMDRGSKFRRTGSAALNLCQVAAGHGDGYVVLSLQPWDVAAALLLIEEAGGAVHRRSARVEDDAIEVVASNGSIQSALVDVVEDELA